MGIVALLDKHRPDKRPAETGDIGHALQFLQGKVHILQGEHGHSVKPLWGRLTKIRHPAVVGPSQGVGNIRVMHQRKSLSEPSGIEQGLINAHRIHVPQPSLRFPRAFVHGMTGLGIQLANRFPRHPGAPQCMARQVDIRRIPVHLAVDFEVGIGSALLSPQGMFAQYPVLGLQVVLPHCARLYHMGIAIKDRKVFCKFITSLRSSRGTLRLQRPGTPGSLPQLATNRGGEFRKPARG